MRKKVLHLQIEEDSLNLIPQKITLKTFTQPSERISSRKNTQSGWFSKRPQTTKASLSKTDNNFYKKRSYILGKRKVVTQAQNRRQYHSIHTQQLLGKTLINNVFSSNRRDRYTSDEKEIAKMNIIKQIEAHNSNMISKMYMVGKQGQIQSRKENMNHFHPSMLQFVKDYQKKKKKEREQSKEDVKIGKSMNQWKNKKKWEVQHKGFKKYFNQNKARTAPQYKAKTQEKEFRPWDTYYIQADEVEY